MRTPLHIACLSAARAFFIVFLLVSVWPVALQAQTAPEVKPAARVGEVVISESQLQMAVNELLPRTYYHGALPAEKKAELRKQALDKLVRNELFYQAAQRQGLKAGAEEIKAGVKTIKSRFKSEADFSKTLKASGMTKEVFEGNIAREIIIDKFVSQEITDKSRISDEQLRELFEKSKSDFLRPEALRLRHILFKVEPDSSKEEKEKIKKEAEEVLAKTRAGEDFAELAFKHSTDNWRIKGGDLGLVHRGRLEQELENEAFSLAPGQVSGLIETLYGFHIIKVEEKLPPTQLSFDDIKEGFRKQTEEKRRAAAEDNILKKMKETLKVEIY